ncbi:hypothetical protein AMATHDRAFT_135273 [Amanita thiersii Skay4041]|uniref:SET domain-containing protein n=1 Tax=Amanita thiersii Skay4041 TaxID=703135 RepID=A0A2A9P044_9AGAR|nr:hypothetical protein AMATHDRAFT_135273 [Amanita thiersii Skay4041]
MPHHPHRRWQALLEWLNTHGMPTAPHKLHVVARHRPGAGYGLFATRSIPPSTPLFTVPSTALLNILTLSPHYPVANPPLTAVQLISLHLALYRPLDDEDSLDPLFGPYISVLPRDFAFHPLTWLRKRKNGLSSDVEARLLELLPPAVEEELTKISDKFGVDWKRVSEYLSKHSNIRTRFCRACPNKVEQEMQFLWAWLNVNTRCIYYRIHQSLADPDNLSLCPILDFANHTYDGPHMEPRARNTDLIEPSVKFSPDDEMTLVSPADQTIEADDELYLVYGAHSNKTLFVEYGFVNQVSREILEEGRVAGEVDVQRYVEDLFNKRGCVGGWMKELLTEEGYWGDWTIHSYPKPAYPSYRLITALRLYHVISPQATLVPAAAEGGVKLWRETLLGVREVISIENECEWEKTLVEVCRKVTTEAKRGVLIVKSAEIEGKSGWEMGAQNMISWLWMEEEYVGGAVLKEVEEGALPDGSALL